MRSGTVAALAALSGAGPLVWEPDMTGIDVSAVRPRVLPAAWAVIQLTHDGGAYRRRDGLAVIVSAERIAEDGRAWLHVSCSRRDKLPSWDDVADVKLVFVGADRYAYQVFAPRTKHVNIHPFCLHVWACMEADDGGRVLPDFVQGRGGI